MITIAKKCALLTGLVLGAAHMASADTVLTFQVDMSVQVGNASFTPGLDTVSAHGSFNGWGNGVTLTNDLTASNINLYTGSVSTASTGPMDYKYVLNAGSYETTQDGNNRVISVGGSSLLVPWAYFADAGPAVTNDVTFQVDLAQQIALGKFTPDSSSIYAQGSFQGWSDTFALTNDPSILRTNQFGLVSSNVYTGVYAYGSPVGGQAEFKYVINNNDGSGDHYESPSVASGDPDNNNNRFFAGKAASQTLPVVFFNDTPYAPVVTDSVTFQVDMSAQAFSGTFDPSQDTVNVQGSFNNWGTTALTNDPASSNTNLYSGIVAINDGVGATEQYKFTFNGANTSGTDWEQPAPGTPQIGGNRYFVLANTNAQVLPPVFFSDVETSDLLPADTAVTFTVDMTAAVGNDGTVFAPGFDGVYINGIPTFTGWNEIALSTYQLTQVGLSLQYSITLNIPKGTSLLQTYKYSIDGNDNEAGFALNHGRFVRSLGTYDMPVDTFGNQLVEKAFGNLTIANGPGETVTLSWLGLPNVELQVSDTPGHGASWISQPATDGSVLRVAPYSGTATTNYSSTDGPLFFRLVKPGVQ